MSSIESYEGLCGCIHRYSTSDLRVRCKYEFAHSGPPFLGEETSRHVYHWWLFLFLYSQS